MANFQPLKNYILYCVDRLIDQYGLAGPFLDAGCGAGDVSRHLAAKGWKGKAIDFSDVAVARARTVLSGFPGVSLEKKSLFDENDVFKTVLMMDMIEHIEDDAQALKKTCSLLEAGGHLVISTPSNPREWRWDDDFYGHYRRYTENEIKEKLGSAGFETVIVWDFTYPVFWMMRRMYTALKSPFVRFEKNKLSRTQESSAANAFDIPGVTGLLSANIIPWSFVYRMQFKNHRNKIGHGHEMIVLARKI